VRAISEQERERATETMRSLQEQTAAETGAIFNATIQGFTETLHDMKSMATDMQRELENTRGELRRGILDLPQETAENAAQMRLVIVEQIDALAELNRIIARHGRGVDVAEAQRRPARDERPMRDEPMFGNSMPRIESPPQPAPQPPRPMMPRTDF